jgi:hypothetical protein
LLIAIVDDDRGACACEAARQRESDPASGAGDQGAFSAQVEKLQCLVHVLGRICACPGCLRMYAVHLKRGDRANSLS